jgi:hypothetical protein
MKALLPALALCLAPVVGMAAEGAWNSAGGQGTFEYSVSDAAGDTLRLVNASGSDSQGEACYLVLEADRLKLPASYPMTIETGGETFRFAMAKGQSDLTTKTAREQLFGFVNTLFKPRKPTFTVSAPGAKLVFATKGASKVLKDALDGCN